MRRVIAPTARPASTSEVVCPSCPNCGFATIRSRQDMTFEVGNPDVRTEPLVRATVTMNIPVFQCTNPNCRNGMYGEDAEAIIEPVRKFLVKNAKPKE